VRYHPRRLESWAESSQVNYAASDRAGELKRNWASTRATAEMLFCARRWVCESRWGYVSQHPRVGSIEELPRFLGQKLPDTCVPIVFLEAYHAPEWKVDRRLCTPECRTNTKKGTCGSRDAASSNYWNMESSHSIIGPGQLF